MHKTFYWKIGKIRIIAEIFINKTKGTGIFIYPKFGVWYK